MSGPEGIRTPCLPDANRALSMNDGGPQGIRTPYLPDANRALYQLS